MDSPTGKSPSFKVARMDLVEERGTLSRRALLAAAGATLGCQSRRMAAPSAGAPSPAALEIVKAGSMRDDETGGTAIVLLHGWGAPGDDLVPLAHELAAPRTRFFVPAAPLAEVGGGRAWWHLDPADRPAHAWSDQEAASHQPHRQVLAVRAAIQQLLRDIRSRHRPDRLVLGGFSQGAMLSLDVALAAEPPVDRVFALSGVLLSDSLQALKAFRQAKPPVFISHGRQDPVLNFQGGQKAKELLERHGFAVEFHPFDGGHEIPPPVVAALRAFLA
jgi:phospholipase/carboxylesterase